jgi:putative endonuclease
MHYTYVLLSEVDGRFYIGATEDLRRRVEKHGAGRVESTWYRRPLRLAPNETTWCGWVGVYYDERYLKSGRGGGYLRQRLVSSLASIGDIKLERH